jgi:hypothetical protein
MRRAVAWLPCALILAGCMDEPNVEFNMGDDSTFANAETNYARDDQFAMLTENGAVKLGLTRERVYFEVSEAVRRHVDDKISDEMDETDSRLARSITDAVRRGVQSAMSIDIDFDIDEIRDVDYRGGELVFEFENDEEHGLDNVEIDDEPITRAFAADDARAFVDAFRRVKAGETLREDSVIRMRTGTLADTTAAGDTADAGQDSSGAAF